MNFGDIGSYFWYILSRNTPTNNLRLFTLKKISYVQVDINCYLGPNVTITPLGGGETYHKENKKPLLEIGKFERCSIIGAGSVVTRDVPKYTVVAGVPAKHLKNLPLKWRNDDE